MKKTLSIALLLFMLASAFSLTVLANENTESVYVTISSEGTLVVAHEKITLTDADNDGSLTINDALYLAHEAEYEGGVEAGYATATTEWGLSIAKLWGNESGNYGYYVNNASAYNLTDTVKDGDFINVFVYADAVSWSDKYCYFDTRAVNAETGTDITLTLSASSYDANWNPVTLPVANVYITVDGIKTEYKTDENGNVTIRIDDIGIHTISAVSDYEIIVPPVCIAKITDTENNVQTGDMTLSLILVTLISGSAVLTVTAHKKNNEK